MPQAGVFVASLMLAALLVILSSAPNYALARSPWGTTHNDKREGSAYNECRASSCQIAYLNSVEDFCLWTPSYPGSDLSATRNTEHTLTAWCIKRTLGTQLIPDGSISWARFVKTPEYVQITGVGNFTNINIPADGVANASGEGDLPGLVFTSAYGQLEQIYDWTSFVSQERFCFRACNPSVATSTPCPRIKDVFGCTENVPGYYGPGVFEDCVGDSIEAPSTLYQGVLAAASHHPSGCTPRGTIGNARVARARRAIPSTSFSTPSALVTLFSWSDRQSTPSGSSIVTTSTDSATTITFPPFPTPTLNVTIAMNSTTPVPTPTSMPYSFNHTHTHWHPHSHNHSRHYFSTSTTPLSSSPSSSYLSFNSSSTGFSLSDPSSTSSPTSFTFTFSTSSSNLPSPGTATSYVTSTPTFTTPVSTPTSMSSSLSESPQPSSFPLSPASTTSSITPPPMSPSTSSQSSIILTFSTSSVPSTSLSTASAAPPNSATQVGTQCPPPSRRTVNAGSITSSTPLLSSMCTLLMIVVLSSIGFLSFEYT